MKLKPIKANMTELEIGDKVVLFSYRTPVAYFSKHEGKLYVTKKRWSNTTTRHINYWVKPYALSGHQEAEKVEQEYLDNLVKGA